METEYVEDSMDFNADVLEGAPAQGIQDNADLINKLIEPELNANYFDINPIISRDTILANLGEDDIRSLLHKAEIYERILLKSVTVPTISFFRDSIARRMKAELLLSRARGGFQNKLLRTSISITRSGVEEAPDNPYKYRMP